MNDESIADGSQPEPIRPQAAPGRSPDGSQGAPAQQPTGTLGWAEATPSARLRECSTVELAGDLLARLRCGRRLAENSREVMTGVHLQMELDAQLDVHENRFGRRRLASNFWNSYLSNR